MRYIVAGAIASILALGAAGYWFYSYYWTTEDAAASQTHVNFAGDGILIKNKPGLKQGGWYFEYAESGSTYTIPIMFSEISMCAWQETAGRCNPSVFIEGRKAHIEGVDLDGAIGVVKLTFTEPAPKNK